MSALEDKLDEIRRRDPHWSPWLAVVGQALREAECKHWDDAVPNAPCADERSPLLMRASITLDGRAARLLEQLARCAATSGTPAFRDLAGMRYPLSVTVEIFRAVLRGDSTTLACIARELEIDPQALTAIAMLLPTPFLHACARGWSHNTGPWRQGYCPVCGSWPAFVESCGIERQRWARCSACGSAWRSVPLHCPYCDARDHAALGTLMLEGASTASVERCDACGGYVKVFTKLARTAAAMVMLEDLASVDVDLAAASRGYARPQETAVPLSLMIDVADA